MGKKRINFQQIKQYIYILQIKKWKNIRIKCTEAVSQRCSYKRCYQRFYKQYFEQHLWLTSSEYNNITYFVYKKSKRKKPQFAEKLAVFIKQCLCWSVRRKLNKRLTPKYISATLAHRFYSFQFFLFCFLSFP